MNCNKRSITLSFLCALALRIDASSAFQNEWDIKSIHSSDLISRNAREWEELYGNNKQVNFTDDFYQASNLVKGTTDHVVDEVVLSDDGQTLAVKGNDNLGNNLYAIYKQNDLRNQWKYEEALKQPLDGQTIPGNNIALSGNAAGIAVAGLSCNSLPTFEPTAGAICYVFGDRNVGDVRVDSFGTSVALNHDSTVFAVGTSQGRINVYDAAAALLKGTLDDSSLIGGSTISIPGSEGQFYTIVKVAGNKMTPTVVVGGNFNRILVYRYEGSTGWRALGNGIISDKSSLSSGGFTDLDGIYFDVSKDGDVIAVRGRLEKNSVKVYEWKSGEWVRRGQDLVADGDDDYASFSLSGDGKVIAIGSYNRGSQTGNSRPGVVMLYEYVNNSWKPYSFPVVGISGLDDEVNFGRSVSLSGNGKVLAVAAPAYSNVADLQKGYVSIFRVGDAFPSAAPSVAPSEKPKTQEPSLSSMPSSDPATPPSGNPTETPSHSPTISFRPTLSPTISFPPTPAPTAAPTPSTCEHNCHCKGGSECDLSECKYDCNCEEGFCNMQKCEYDCRCKGGNCNMNRCGSNCQCEMRGCQMDNCIYNTRCVARATSGTLRKSGTLVISTMSLVLMVLSMI